MLDTSLRPIKDDALRRPARLLAPYCRPLWFTGLALAASLAAALLAWRGLTGPAVAAWLIGRVLDGLDGLVARLRHEAADWGGYLDMLGDTIGYAIVPLGVAAAVDQRSTWIAVAVLLATFYVNSVSWTYLSALAEKRGFGAAVQGEVTSVTMPRALIEGTETIAFYTLFLAFPSWATGLFAVMAGLVTVNVAQRLVWAQRFL